MSILQHSPIPLPKQLIDELQRLYRTPHRFYHNFTHIEKLLTLYHQLADQWEHPIEVYLAFLYHDAVYEYGAKDNEEQSARVAQREIQKHLSHHHINIDIIMTLIRHTANHGDLRHEDLNEEERLFLDCDMSIVGSSFEDFCVYEQQIEQEYTQVYPLLLYRVGREKFRQTLLRAPRIFFSEYFHRRLDSQARKNLEGTTQK